MNEFLIYALKSILALALFALAYRISLIGEGNFAIRRLYLLSSVILSMILPFFKLKFPVGNFSLPGVVLDEITVYSNGIRLVKETSSIPLTYYLQIIYFSVAGFLILRVLLNTIVIIIKTSRNMRDPENEEVKLFILKDKNISYSFFRNIFIGQTADKEEQERILAHEKVHALQLHSVDVLFIEILTCLFWFNPMLWWFRNEIKNVHEYLADKGALENGFNRKKYQITLLEHLIGSASISITNNFNYSLIKNRIAMMNKEKNGRKNTWKVFLLVPVSLVIALAFACTQKNTDTNSSELKPVYYQAEQMPEFPGGFDSLRMYIARNIIYPAEAAKNNVSGKVAVQFVVDENGKIVTESDKYQIFDETKKENSVIKGIVVVAYKPAEGSPTENMDNYIDLLKEEAVRVISSLPDFEKPGIQNGKAVAVQFTLPINFALQ
jgi:hypothetical protein